MTQRHAASLFFSIALAAGVTGPSLGAQQGDDRFTNFETPQVHPIEAASLPRYDAPGQLLDVVFVCNAPDNTLEVYDAGTMSLLARVPVDHGPASVRWFPLQSAPYGLLYVCCIDGDSVALLTAEATGPAQVDVRLLQLAQVGDQPADIALAPSFNLVAVTLSGRSSVAYLRPITLAPVDPSEPETVLELTDAADEVVYPFLSQRLPAAVNEPRQIDIGADNRMFVLNHRGDTPGQLPVGGFGAHWRGYDLDLWWSDPPNQLRGQVRELGSTNQAFARTSDGQTMVVVGTSARNVDARGELGLAMLPFGFVESWMWIVQTPSGSAPSKNAEAPAATTPTPALPSRNLNRDYSTATGAVMPPAALSQPTGVALRESAPGVIDLIAVTAYHSDRVALLSPNVSAFGGYDVTIIDLTPMAGYSVAGPRAVEYHPATGLFYVACRLDNSVRVIDPATATESQPPTALFNDPTPDVIRDGRRFLYSAKLSGSGFVSCASCHIDARTDGLAWDLGEPNAGPTIPAGLPGGGVFEPGTLSEFPHEKGFLVTQTLQGLVNDVVNPAAQPFLTNAPYHWRGDRQNFQAFILGFHGLLVNPAVTAGDMDVFTAFINTVRHTPNPEQDRDRVVPGAISGSGATLAVSGVKEGLAAFHNVSSLGLRSCVDCHSLPEGSDNTLTDFVQNDPQLPNHMQPIETAQLRGVVAREGRLLRGDSDEWGISNEGILHNGADSNIETIDQFLTAGFNLSPTARPEVIRYVRQFDHGIAPAATRAFTLLPDPGSTVNKEELAWFELQVGEANCGLAVRVRSGASYTGYWYDITGSVPIYREEGTANTTTNVALRAMAGQPDTTIVLLGTPLGSARRIASAGGVATQLTGPWPSGFAPRPAAPTTWHVDIPRFDGAMHIDWSTGTIDPNLSTAATTWALRTFQYEVVGQHGVTPTHIPPRRLRISGTDVREGARLFFGYGEGSIVFDLYPTHHTTSTGQRVWETEEELDPMMQMFFINGGPNGTDTWRVLHRLTTTPNLSSNQNLYDWFVVNEDGSFAFTAQQMPLVVQNSR